MPWIIVQTFRCRKVARINLRRKDPDLDENASHLRRAGRGTALPAPAQETNGLSQPVIALTGVLAKRADTLALTGAQRAAILGNAPVADRQALAERIGETEAARVMMRSNCTDHWRSVLTPEQFARRLTLAGLGWAGRAVPSRRCKSGVGRSYSL